MVQRTTILITLLTLFSGCNTSTPPDVSSPEASSPVVSGSAEHGATVAVDGDNFKSVVLESSLPVLVDFWAEWCGPCKAIAPTVTDLATDVAGSAVVAKLDIDVESGRAIAEQYNVQSIPTLIVFKDGKEVDRITGGNVSKAKLAAMLNNVH